MRIQNIKVVNLDETITRFCRELDTMKIVTHDHQHEKLFFYHIEKEEEKIEVAFCPYCGFSYQPERLNPETSKEDAIV